MKKVLILVEGATEVAFIKQVIAPAMPGLWLVPTEIKTRVTGARPKKGGSVNYHEFKRQMNLLLEDTSAACVTTMLDYQGMNSDYPGRERARSVQTAQRATTVEAAMKADVSNDRFLPFVALHEFEALLFVRPALIAEILRRPQLTSPLQEIRNQYPSTPEEINDSSTTSPSARIETLCENLCGSARIFQKRTHSPIIAGKIGLAQIRAECPHFNGWLTKLEEIANR